MDVALLLYKIISYLEIYLPTSHELQNLHLQENHPAKQQKHFVFHSLDLICKKIKMFFFEMNNPPNGKILILLLHNSIILL